MDLNDYVGKTGSYEADGLTLPVTITSVRSVFGRKELLVSVNCYGAPSKWVTLGKVKNIA